MSYKLDGLPGMEEDDIRGLNRIGIVSTGTLLDQCSSVPARALVATETGIDENRLLDWARRVDLARISGVGPNTAERLLSRGIYSVADLRTRSAGELGKLLSEGPAPLFGDSNILGRVARWIKQSNQLRLVLR
ncbi:MAG: putative flap endonuclease-1-like 5' DNA nuclease [Gammaproteobacteria bacterium]|jgi:predicted flap endonuclease-1-like 5' DNA nuclease